MYNLLIGPTYGEVGAERMLEHTSDAVRQYVAPSTDAGQRRGDVRVDRLLNLPTLLMPETGFNDVPQIARIGHVSNLVRSGRTYNFTFTANPAISPVETSRIESAAVALGITQWEFNRTHWAVKDVDLYRVLDEEVPFHRPRPKVFEFPTYESADPDLVAVMMPFDERFSRVYETLKRGVESSGMRCLRADDIWERDHIMDDVISLIWRSRVVIADLTGKNPNVLYEAGIAHTLGRDVILIAQSLADIPFDLRSFRALSYLDNDEGRQQLADGISKRLHTITKRSAF